MASLLSMGAGASEGLDKYLQRMMLEEQMAQAKQKQASDDTYRNKALEQSGEANRLTRESLDQNRRATLEAGVRDDLRTSLSQIPGGTEVAPETYQSAIKLRAATPERFDIQSKPDASSMDAGVPESLAPNDPVASKILLRKTPGELATDARLSDADERLKLAQENQALREFLGKNNLSARWATENRLREWGPSTVTIGDVNNPGSSVVVHKNEIPEGGAPAPVPGGVQTQAIGNDTATAQLDRLEELFKTSGGMVGPAEGRLRSIGQNIPGVPVNQDWAEMEAASAAFKNSVIKAITGAQMSEVEAKRIQQQIPLVTDKPEVWQAKARQTRKNLADLERVVGGRQGGGTGGGGKKVIRYDIDGNVIP